MKPLAIDLFCGLGGWTEGLLAAGYFVVGFDNERHVYGEQRYPAQQKETNRNPVHELAGIKGSDGYERDHPNAFGWKKPGMSSHSSARKAASAMIAKIPFELARHVAKVWFPQ